MRFLLSILFVSLSYLSFAQPPGGQGMNQAIGSLDGQVFDSVSRKPLEYVELRVCKIADSSVVTGIFTDEEGKFVLEQIPLGSYFIRVSQSGYREKILRNIQLTQAKPLRKLGNISLVSDAEEIEEVVIRAEKPILQAGIDKKVYNVGEDVSVQGGTANDVLNNVPSVEVDQDGAISLRGEGNVTILIDGKPSSLSGSNGKGLLAGIPASSIERIEIVTNPSAKYDPDGTAGIINIVLKKNIRIGLNGNVSVSAGTGDVYNASTSLNMRNTKFNVFGNYSFDHREGDRNQYSDMTQTYSGVSGDSLVYFNQDRYGTDYSETHTAKVGMDIYLKDRNTLSWNLSGNLGQRNRFGDQDNYRYNTAGDTAGIWNRMSWDPSYNRGLDLGLTYSWEFKDNKGNVDWSAYQSFGDVTNGGYYLQSYTLPSNGTATDQRLFSLEQNKFTTLQMDVVRIFNEKWRTESGLKLIHRNMTVNTHSDSRDANGDYQPDTLADYDYAYTERIYSAYGIVGRVINKWKFQGGLRFEQSYQEPNLISENQSYSNNYFNIFPSGHVRYEVAKGTEFSLGYSKRINRPSSDNLNPFTSYADPYNLRRGNPALRPEYIHSVDLSFDHTRKKWGITASVYQRYSIEVIQRVKIFYEDGTSAGTFANIDNSSSTGGELVLQIKPLPIWRNTLSFNGNYIRYTDDQTSVNWNREGFVYGMKFATTVELWKRTLTMQLNGRYNAPSVTAQGQMQPRGSMEFSAEKSFMDGKWAVGMRVSDIFDTQGFRFKVEQPTVTQEMSFKQETRRLFVTLRYKFGRNDFTDRKKGGEQQPGGGGGFDF